MRAVTTVEGVRISLCGVSAYRVTADTGDADRDWRIVHHLARASADLGEMITCAIPTYEAVLLEFDPVATVPAEVLQAIHSQLAGLDVDQPLVADPRTFVVPVYYGGAFGPDLGYVAELTGMRAADVIALHHENPYLIRCLGAPGGSPMLDAPRFPVAIPRLTSPRAKVAAGVVSLAGRQATIAPTAAPGGWQVIGQTPLVLFDVNADPLIAYRPGDLVRFEPIGEDEFVSRVGEPLRAEGPSA